MCYDSIMTNKKASVIHDENAVREAVRTSSSIKDVLTALGLRPAGGNYKALKTACQQLGIELPAYDYSSGLKHHPIGFNGKIALADDKVFVRDSTYTNRAALKKRLFAMGVPNVCSCGQGPEWNGKPITLTLEHKNGIANDHRLENLEILCPNCHSQTDTFAGKNSSRVLTPEQRKEFKSKAVLRSNSNRRHHTSKNSLPKPPRICRDCPNEIVAKSKSGHCFDCSRKARYATSYPEVEILVGMVKEKGFVKVAAELGVTDNAVRKHLKKSLPVSHPIFAKKKKQV